MNFIKHTVFLCLLSLQVNCLFGMEAAPAKQPVVDLSNTFDPALFELIEAIRLNYEASSEHINELIIKGYIKSLGTIDKITKEKINVLLYTQTIEKLYKKLALKFHPDKNNDYATIMQQLVDIKENASVALPPYRKLISNFKIIIETNKLKEKLLNKEKALHERRKIVPIALLIHRTPRAVLGQCAFSTGNDIGKNLSEHFFGNEKKERQLNKALSATSKINLKNLESIKKSLDKKIP